VSAHVVYLWGRFWNQNEGDKVVVAALSGIVSSLFTLNAKDGKA